MAVKSDKITIFGSGTVGSAIAYSLIMKGLSEEIVLINRNMERAQAKAMDLAHCAPLLGGVKVTAGDFPASADSDIVIITAGVLPKETGTRMDVLARNIQIYKEIIPEIAKHSPEAVIVTVTNPVDVMAYVAYRLSGFPPERVIGTGTLLDTIRFKYILGSRFNVDSSQVEGEVMGEHGDSMFPVWSRVKIYNKPLQEFLDSNGLVFDPSMKHIIEEETKRAGWKIRLGNEHTCYGISLSTAKIVESILGFSEDAIPVSTLLKGEYGVRDVFLSIPSVCNRKGISRSEIIVLNSDEHEQLLKSAEIINKYKIEADSLL